MSKHPIPGWLRSQFSRIEDEVQELGPCGVFTQMRTVTQTYFEQQAEAVQPPALGGEPEVVGYGFRNTMVGRSPVMMELRPDIPANDQYGGQLWYPLITQDDYRAHIAPLQAEIENLKAELAWQETDNQMQAAEIDQLKARCDELESLLAKYFNNPAACAYKAYDIDAALSRPAGSEQV